MRMTGFVLGAVLISAALPALAEDKSVLPAGLAAWAYPGSKTEEPFPQLPTDAQFSVEGSALHYSGDELNKMTGAVDWLPSDHGAAPDIVSKGDHARKIEACGGCHGMSGQGALGIPNLNGLPAAYIAEQLHELATGRRHSADPDREVVTMMAGFAKGLTDAEIADAAKYFSSIAVRRPLMHVVETDQAPKTRANFYGWLEAAPGGGTEPIGHRLIEVAENFNQLWIGDPHAPTIVYVPKGAIERGKALVQHAAQPCTSCHGANLKGMGKIPALAGRDPQYLARVLWDIKSGARGGATVALMQKPVANLSEDQIIDLVAYIASLAP